VLRREKRSSMAERYPRPPAPPRATARPLDRGGDHFTRISHGSRFGNRCPPRGGTVWSGDLPGVTLNPPNPGPSVRGFLHMEDPK